MDELCGVSGPDRVRDGDETLEQHVMRLTQPAIRRWRDALAASEDPRRQAIELAVTNAQPDFHILTAEERGTEPSKDTPVNNRLVLLATESSDPAIYSLAIGECQRGTDDMAAAAGPCQGLSWEHWADIDSDNGMPWLWIAAKAQRAGDQQEVEEALAKASTASRIEGYGSMLTALAIAALPSASAPLEKAVAGTTAISMNAVGTPFEIMSLCSVTAIQQTVRNQECSAIATTLAKRGSTLIDLLLAARMADRLAFPPETRSALSAESLSARAYSAKISPWRIPSEGSEFRCERILAYDRYIDSLRGGSERGALLAIAPSGR